MICLETVKRYCKEYWKIANYDQAMADTTQTWACHHRFEIECNLSTIDLQAMGFYFNRPFYELIFLTPYDHKSLHHKGKIISEETKTKMREIKLGKYVGENNPMYGKEGCWHNKKREPFSDEWKRKISDTLTQINISVEELYDLYVVQGLSQSKIAKIYGCSQGCIFLKLKKHNIKK